MKKILLLLGLAICFSQLKAQQFFQVKPVDSITHNLDKLLKITPVKPLQLVQPKLNLSQAFNNNLAAKLTTNIDHMPVAVLSGNSKMPVLKPGGYYTMPVKKIGGGDESTGLPSKTP